MELNSLTAISPLDGRYENKMDLLRPYMSEYALIYHRLLVEIRWVLALTENPLIQEITKISKESSKTLDAILQNFDLNEAKKIKAIEKKTNHDVKAVEYYLREQLKDHPELKKLIPFLHFGATSEDINNLAYSLMIKEVREKILLPLLKDIIFVLHQITDQYSNLPMLSRTHGQAATPTTLGKEIANVIARLQKQIESLLSIPIMGKWNGAVGNYNAYQFSYPEIHWPSFCEQFVTRLGLTWNPYTTQIEPHDRLAELLHALIRINTIFIDLNRDIWTYISFGYFTQKAVEDEVGSSTMPHKVNPIDFENSEGNLGVANALASFMAEKLPISRLQRDLSDSTVLRNLGMVFGHSFLAYQSLFKGLGKLEAHSHNLKEDLNQHWEILAEPIQTLLRRYGIADAYEQLKNFSRGKKMDAQMIKAFIITLDLPEDVKKKLEELQPEEYLGYAQELAKKLIKQT